MLNKLKRKRVTSDAQVAPHSGYSLPSKHEVNSAERGAPDNAYRASSTTIEQKATQHGTLDIPPMVEPTPETQPIEPCVLAHAPRAGDMEIGSETKDSATLTPLQQTIEAQFGLEILLKHNELRLIDQELAKCQIALEQLRRCSIIPFPTAASTPSAMTSVSSGSGPVKDQGRRGLEPQHPAPWGVTDGPYTRHYAKWLIPDPVFDGGYTGEACVENMPQGFSCQGARSTRGSYNDSGSGASKSRMQRGSTGSNLQALSNAYHQPRDKAGPLIIKRTTDGQYVKLVCLDCERGDFSSAQGFINHCRIAHHRGFESHDAAAIACGQILDASEASTVIDGAQSGNLGTAGLVHPLIKSASPYPLGPPTPIRSPTSKASDEPMHRPGIIYRGVFDSTPNHDPMQSSSTRSSIKPQVRSQYKSRTKKKHEVKAGASAFVPSPQTPHLSALMRERGFVGDLDEMVGKAKAKIDFGLNDPQTSSDDDEPGSSLVAGESKDTSLRAHQARRPTSGTSYNENTDGSMSNFASIGRLPICAGMSPAPLDRPNSRKGLAGGTNTPRDSRAMSPRRYHTPYVDTRAGRSDAPSRANYHDGDNDVIMLDGCTSLNHSPNTIESNPAPSLVSDDGDYEAHSESESPNSTDADGEDAYLGIGAEDDATDHEMSTVPKAMPSRRPSALRGEVPREGFEARHVTFVSPRKNKKDHARKFGGGGNE
ncbi:MAG: hypothetical protein M1812_007286 [Candelaria pacifica]|nr:MAG: hypothetical protein M1812_007286 [Candelaria pacifica]